MDTLIFFLVLFIAAFGAPLWAMWRWRGLWRLAAALPAIVIGAIIVVIAVQVWRDPTSNNLWPLGLLMMGGMGAIYIALLRLARQFIGAER